MIKPEHLASPLEKMKKEPTCRFVRSVTLRNIRTFKSGSKLDLCFPNGRLAQWTIILGENGSGKTTLLQYIAGIAPVQDRNPVVIKGKGQIFLLAPFLSQQAFFSWHWENLSKPRDLPKEIEANVLLTSPISSWSKATKAKAAPKGISLEIQNYKFNFTAEGLESKSTQREVHQAEEFAIFGYGAGRHVANPGSPYLASESFLNENNNSTISSLFRDDQPLMSPEQWLLSLDHQSKATPGTENGQRAAATLRRAKECLCRVLPDVINIHIKPYGRNEASMAVLFTTPFGEIQFSGLSLGYRTMASWVIDFVRKMHQRYPQLPEPEKGPAVVLIDEFDLHMHPRWQIQMMDRLGSAFTNTQFIITAHSPLVVQAADGNANIALLKRIKNKDGVEEVIIENDPAHVRGWRIDQILTSDLYGLASSRSKSYAILMGRRVELLQKKILTKKELKELEVLEERLDAESPPDNVPIISIEPSSKKHK